MNQIIILLILALCVEAITEIFVASELFFKLRDWIASFGYLPGTFVNCGYCVSVWISGAVVWMAPQLVLKVGDSVFGYILPNWLVYIADYLVRLFIVHRAANVVHELFSRWFKRMPWVLVLTNPSVQGTGILETPYEEPQNPPT